jgi:hypothetical protein
MLTLKFPSHATNILGGNRNGRRHGLLQGFNRGGNREAVGSMYVSRYFILLIHLRDEKEKVRVWLRKGFPIYPVSKVQCMYMCIVLTMLADLCALVRV